MWVNKVGGNANYYFTGNSIYAISMIIFLITFHDNLFKYFKDKNKIDQIEIENQKIKNQ